MSCGSPGRPTHGTTSTCEHRLGASDGDQAILVIEARGMPLDLIAAHGTGWQIHVENLAAYLAGRERVDSEARWAELIPPYQDRAANIG
jgi:hypothetical protein